MNAVIVESILTLIPAFLRTLASAPASSSFITPSLDVILTGAAALIERGDAAAQALAALTQHIQAMSTANADPTPEDWSKLIALSNAAHTIIQGSAPTVHPPAATQPPLENATAQPPQPPQQGGVQS